MNNKALMQALACFSLLVCQQLMAGDKQVAKLPAAMGSTIAAARDSLNKSFLVARDKKQSLIAEALLVEGLAAGRYEGLEQLVGNEQLNYTTSKSIRIPVPQTRYVVVADFGFAGSGDLDLELMMPLPTVKIRLEANEEVGMSPLVATNASDLVKMCVENEINKMVSRDGGLENLKQLGISPILKPRAVFLCKLALLIDYTVKTGDVEFFYKEVSRLLFRLIISGDIAGVVDEKAPLTTLLPERFVLALGRVIPNLLPVLDQIFISTKQLLKTHNVDSTSVKTFAFIFFSNQDIAEQFAAFAKTAVNQADGLSVLENHLTASRAMQVIDFDAFYDLLKDGQTDSMSAKFLVGKATAYGKDAVELVEQGILSAVEARSVASEAGTVSVVPRGKFTVVCCTTDKAYLDQLETFSSVVQLIASSWNSYVNIVRTEVDKGQNIESNELLLEDTAERQELRKFLATETGARLQARLEEALKVARNPFEKVRLKRDQLLESLDQQEQALKEVEKTLAQNHAAATKLASHTLNVFPEQYVASSGVYVDIVADLNARIASGYKKQQVVNTEILRLKKELEFVEKQLQDLPLDTKHVEIEEIMRVLSAQRANGQRVDADLRRRLEDLQRKMTEDADTQKVEIQALSIEEKIDLRDAVLEVYKNELNLVSIEIATLKKQELNVDVLMQESLLELYKKFLVAQVERRTKQKDALNTLVLYKKTLKEIGALPQDRMAEFYELERNYGFIFTSNDVLEICRVTKPKLSVASRFIQELSQPAAGSPFEAMHKDFIEGLSTIIARSDVARENSVMIKYLLASLLPMVQHQILVKVANLTGNVG